MRSDVHDIGMLTYKAAFRAGFMRGIADRVLLEQWDAIVDALGDPMFELDGEEFAVIFSTFRELQMRGAIFDPFIVGILYNLARQLRDTEADEDSDNHDADLDLDDNSGGELYGASDDPDDDNGAL